MFDRLLAPVLRSSRRSALVLGPRQVGKSTLLATLEPDLVVNLADPGAFRDYVAQPERLSRELASAPEETRTVFLDEVQRVPALLDAVQVLLDQRPPRFRFLLSGSSARKLRPNLLPGRIHVHYMHPLLVAELGSDFDLDRMLAHGSLPGIYSEADDATRALDLRSYVDTYLRAEIQAEALVRDVGGFARLLDLAAAASGRILNLNSLCKDAGISYETARRYLDVLEDTLVAFRVPAWSGSDRSSLVRHGKLFLFDLGVRNALLRRPLDRPLDDERGLLLEHLVAYELQRRLGTLWPEAALYHYRTRHGAEVDFVLEVGREVWGIEVKASRRADRSVLRGFRSLAQRTDRLKRRLVVYLGDRAQRIEDVEVWPFEEFAGLLPA
ncbi:MAG: ATP-binding protein [Holophagales bacterium]|nr:ATP-binding protein [Holophagales bacterium]MYC11052.1 ATP-binding protein [Holophagales bacterium]